MYFPTWIDLKGQDSVPETVHHCVSGLHSHHYKCKIVINQHVTLLQLFKPFASIIYNIIHQNALSITLMYDTTYTSR